MSPLAGGATRRWPRGQRRWSAPWVPVPVPAGDPRVQVAGLRVTRAGRPVLDGVDLRVRAGEVHALVGPNGAGKSTLLAAVSGDLPAAAGTIEIDRCRWPAGPRWSWRCAGPCCPSAAR